MSVKRGWRSKSKGDSAKPLIRGCFLCFASLAVAIVLYWTIALRQLEFVDAAGKGDLNAVHRYLAFGFRPDTQCLIGGGPPLGAAAACGQTQVVKLFLDRHAPAIDAWMLAISNHRSEVLVELIRAGADVNVDLWEFDIHGSRIDFSPLDYADEYGDDEIRQLLKAAGARKRLDPQKHI